MSRFSDLQELFVIVCRMICIKNGVKSKVYLIIYSGGNFGQGTNREDKKMKF